MKLLFDQNLSFKLCQRLVDLFPDLSHVRLVRTKDGGRSVHFEHTVAVLKDGIEIMTLP